jgi:hypothetical protein
MAKLHETLPSTRQLEIAVRTNRPAALARTFALFVGQFYDRLGFDALARRAHDLYALQSPVQAQEFRLRLDRRLRDRYRPPVSWTLAPATNRAA